MIKLWAMLGAVNALVSVAAGAFGAHALRARLSDRMLNAFEVGARYQMYHAFALLAVAVLGAQPGVEVSSAGWAFVLGIALFSGSLYAMALTDTARLGMITPLGGVSFLVGWALFARAAASLPR